MADPRLLTYEGCNFFRQRLVLATLSSRPVRITRIREDADEPGLKGLCVCVWRGYVFEGLCWKEKERGTRFIVKFMGVIFFRMQSLRLASSVFWIN